MCRACMVVREGELHLSDEQRLLLTGSSERGSPGPRRFGSFPFGQLRVESIK